MKKKVFVNPSVQMVECEATTIIAQSQGNISGGGAGGRDAREMNSTPEANDNFFLN